MLAQRESRAKQQAKAAISSPILLQQGSRVRELQARADVLDLSQRSRPQTSRPDPSTPALKPHRRAPLPPSPATPQSTVSAARRSHSPTMASPSVARRILVAPRHESPEALPPELPTEPHTIQRSPGGLEIPDFAQVCPQVLLGCAPYHTWQTAPSDGDGSHSSSPVHPAPEEPDAVPDFALSVAPGIASASDSLPLVFQ